jgi:hypothetical protein
MGNMTRKLIAALLALILSVTMVVVSSYAWLIQSSSPEIEGMYVSVGGGNTILLAADLTVTEDDRTYHFPGSFSDRLNFSQYESYDYLQQLGGMTPVSTADGVNWYLPAYYNKDDALVKYGTVADGQLRPVKDFVLDDRLTHANLTRDQQEQIEAGSYIYLDFWVVSPGADYRLHISTGEETSGSFAIGLPEVVAEDRDGDGQDDSYGLADSGSRAAAASVRIGFLANHEPVTDLSMFYYQRSEQFAARYTQLRGVYSEKFLSAPDLEHRFLIYEPNGTLHMDGDRQGSYVITEPLEKAEKGAQKANVSTKLTVQGENTWLAAANAETTRLQQAFETATVNETFNIKQLQNVRNDFYKDYLQQQLASYVDDADFYTHTGNLYALAKKGIVSQTSLAENTQMAGATDDVYIVDLKKDIPQRIRMFIWLEGQDIDCTNDAAASAVAINIELAGSSVNG